MYIYTNADFHSKFSDTSYRRLQSHFMYIPRIRFARKYIYTHICMYHVLLGPPIFVALRLCWSMGFLNAKREVFYKRCEGSGLGPCTQQLVCVVVVVVAAIVVAAAVVAVAAVVVGDCDGDGDSDGSLNNSLNHLLNSSLDNS
jgi:hypothetical protein